jgi:uncharacterized protein (DUF2147 family)
LRTYVSTAAQRCTPRRVPTESCPPQMEGSRQQAVPAEAVPQEGQEREHKWAAKYGGRQVELKRDGKHVYAQGFVARTRCWANSFDVLIAGTNVWFRIGFHVDLVKWAFMEGKTIFVQGVEEAGDNCFTADYFHTV